MNHHLLNKCVVWHFALCSRPLSAARSIMVVTDLVPHALLCISHFENYAFNNLAHSDPQFMIYSVFRAGNFIFDVSLMISLSSDLQIQYGGGDHLENCMFNSLVLSAVWLMVCGIFGAEEVILMLFWWLVLVLGFDFKMAAIWNTFAAFICSVSPLEHR